MFSIMKISIFSDLGRQKLQDLYSEINTFSQQIFDTGSSDFSKAMIQNILKVLDSLIQHNDVGYWKRDAHREELMQLIDIVDNSKRTYVPEVFNAQSHALAKILLAALAKINCATDLNNTALLSLRTIAGDPNELIKTMQDNLHLKIKLYEFYINNLEQAIHLKNLQTKIYENFESFIDKIENESIENFATFKTEYQACCKTLFQEIDTLAYVKLANARSFVNAEKPMAVTADELESSGNRGQAIWIIIALECQLNEKLKTKGLPLLTTVHDFYANSFSPAACTQLQKAFTQLITRLQEESEKYKNGDHLPFFKKLKGVDPGKIACLDTFNKHITAIAKENDPVGILSFKAFKATFTATKQNENVASKKNISLGQLSRLLNSYEWQFLVLSILQSNQTNDAGILKRLNSYETTLGLDLSHVPSNNNDQSTPRPMPPR